MFGCFFFVFVCFFLSFFFAHCNFQLICFIFILCPVTSYLKQIRTATSLKATSGIRFDNDSDYGEIKTRCYNAISLPHATKGNSYKTLCTSATKFSRRPLHDFQHEITYLLRIFK